MDGAYSKNTIRAYRADFAIFEAWCRQQRRAALPASPETVADFVLAQSESATPATVSRRRASIAKIHRLLKLENPVRTEEVNLAARTVFRQKGRRQDQALGLTSVLKQKLISICADDLYGLRDRALIAVGYDTLCRRAELVQLQIDDLTIKPDGSGTILVRKSKADQFGDGRLAYVSGETLGYLRNWLRAADLSNGPIFRNIHSMSATPGALHHYSVVRVLKDRAKAAGLDGSVVAKLSGHSMRVGAAQDLAAAGIDLGAIMHAGGWKTPDMVMRYIEHMDVGKSGMARLYAVLPSKGDRRQSF
ncbi:MAG: tyrosine-type recombinase/integrase [Alphaproteobacteria bacterium]|nr:tyrosine-type recombinase/integrase [Alphaproteobacteria bacterium]